MSDDDNDPKEQVSLTSTSDSGPIGSGGKKMSGENSFVEDLQELLNAHQLDEIDLILNDASPGQLDQTISMFGKDADELCRRNTKFLHDLLETEVCTDERSSAELESGQDVRLKKQMHRLLGQSMAHFILVAGLCGIVSMDISGTFRTILSALLFDVDSVVTGLPSYSAHVVATAVAALAFLLILASEKREMLEFQAAARDLRADVGVCDVAEDIYYLSKTVSSCKRLKSYGIVISAILVMHAVISILVAVAKGSALSVLQVGAISFEALIGVTMLLSSLMLGLLTVKSQMSIVNTMEAMRTDESGVLKNAVLGAFSEDLARDRYFFVISRMASIFNLYGFRVHRN